MALDHYVSQVHLKKFYSPALGERMFALRKSDLKAFTPNSKSVCRIENGSTNAYLRDDRAVEDFLQTIEPRYNAVVGRLLEGKVDDECIEIVAGFAAYISICTPAAIRANVAPLKAMVENEIVAADKMGLLPPPPTSIDAKNLSELIEKGLAAVNVDAKFPQAIGIAAIKKRAAMFGNCAWELLRNPFDDSPFVTSDNPVAIEETSDPRVIDKVLPLSPRLAVRIHPDVRLRGREPDPAFGGFRHRITTLRKQEVLGLNTLLVRCAEDCVFFRDDRAWVHAIVKKNRDFRLEVVTEKIKTDGGIATFSRQAISRYHKQHFP